MPYKLSSEAKMDLARIYWRGVEKFGELQADRYYETLIQRFSDIAEAPHKYQSVDHIRESYRRSVCGWIAFTTAWAVMLSRSCECLAGRMQERGFNNKPLCLWEALRFFRRSSHA